MTARSADFISMARRRASPGTGSSASHLAARTARTEWPDLREVLRGIRWAVAGAVATRAYMPERATRDIVVVVMSEDADDVRQRLDGAQFERVQELTIGGATWRTPQGIEVDVIETEALWAREALASPEQDAAGLPVLPLPYLVLMKLQSGRTQDLADISRMLGTASDEDLDLTEQVVKRYEPEATDDLVSLVELGKLEHSGTP